MSDEGPALSVDQVRTAAAVGRLPELARQLVLDRRWSSLEVLLLLTAGTTLPVEEAAAALRALLEALAALPDADRREAAAELRESQRQAATALARRAEATPQTDRERAGLRTAAALFAALGELRRAATLYEQAGADGEAAETWGALGDLDRMEACLNREEQHRTARLRTTQARRTFEMHLAAGERLAAIAAALAVPDVDLDSHDLMARARALENRLCRGRTVALRARDGRVLRAAALPASIGRDPTAEIPVREPTVSRRHAVLLATEAGEGLDVAPGVALEDAGSRGGTRLGGFAVAGRLPLHDEGEITLGAACRLRFQVRGAGLELRGSGGLDREHWTLVGPGTVEIGPALGLPAGLSIDFSSGAAQLVRPAGLPLRLAGHLIGPRCELLHGDLLDTLDGVQLEIL